MGINVTESFAYYSWHFIDIHLTEAPNSLTYLSNIHLFIFYLYGFPSGVGSHICG
jgi:hypothetical protein